MAARHSAAGRCTEAQHMVERAVFEHEHHDVLDSVELVIHTRVSSWLRIWLCFAFSFYWFC